MTINNEYSVLVYTSDQRSVAEMNESDLYWTIHQSSTKVERDDAFLYNDNGAAEPGDGRRR